MTMGETKEKEKNRKWEKKATMSAKHSLLRKILKFCLKFPKIWVQRGSKFSLWRNKPLQISTSCQVCQRHDPLPAHSQTALIHCCLCTIWRQAVAHLHSAPQIERGFQPYTLDWRRFEGIGAPSAALLILDHIAWGGLKQAKFSKEH